ncbi:hypothetical protein PIB30_098626 [Stylosanthes scabra]|uniref:Uncharacterized protein n=1 Tax=Stylosanthes scabra TaxID=79078 RepID=A0ABU6TXH6_9FABA|nr:hypothetical protein [Stylosanthes scabra]
MGFALQKPILDTSESTLAHPESILDTPSFFSLHSLLTPIFSLLSPRVLATMSRHKTPAVKLKSKSVPRKDPPQLSQLPLRKWFPIKEVWEDYQNFYSKMLILPPRFLSEGLLPEDKYPEFWELIDF